MPKPPTMEGLFSLGREALVRIIIPSQLYGDDCGDELEILPIKEMYKVTDVDGFSWGVMLLGFLEFPRLLEFFERDGKLVLIVGVHRKLNFDTKHALLEKVFIEYAPFPFRWRGEGLQAQDIYTGDMVSYSGISYGKPGDKVGTEIAIAMEINGKLRQWLGAFVTLESVRLC